MKKILCLLVTLAVMWVFEAQAKTEFSADIEVDVTAKDAVEAKEKAMRQAPREAFMEVAGRLTEAENVEKLEKLTDDEILHFVRSVSVNDEKSGGNKYKATLTVQLNEPMMREYLAENDMIETEVKDLLVIPIFKAKNTYTPLLWEADNEWRRAWLGKGLIKFGTMLMHTIGEHFQQIDQLNAESALYMDSVVYNSISNINGSDRVYVVYAETMENDDLKITIKDEKNKAENNFSVLNDGSENIFDKAIEKSVMFISNMERESQSNAGNAEEGILNVVYMYDDMRDWLTKSSMLAKMPMVDGIETKSFGGGKVNFSIRYSGPLEDFWQALQEMGFTHEAADNYYIIR